MNFDHYFSIGKPHAAQGLPCQDYAGSGALPGGAAFAVVADGCSGAQARTEIGAQAMVTAFERLLPAVGNRLPASDELADALMTEIGRNRISGNDLDYLATLVGVVVGSDFGYAVVFGDGVIAERFADGRIRTTEVYWADNMPFYPAYRWSNAARSGFIHRLGKHAATAVTVRIVESRGVGATLDRLSISEVALPFAAVEHGLQLDLTSDLADLQSVAVFSDGVGRIGGLDSAAACAELLAFKTLRGQFVKRRCLRALASWGQHGKSPGDDVSMAAISLGGAP